MEELLRGKEVFTINPFDLSKNIVYFPIRHHSPVCAWHLKEAIRQYEPDCILIEGPDNANELIPVLTHPDTNPPLAIYYSYRDKNAYINEEKEDYKCYYPFLSCSPELVALKCAKEREIHSEFMDLPYVEILIGTSENKGIRKEGEKNTYNDDYLLSRSKYITMLLEKTGLRNFDEFWEKYFEIQGLYETTEEFVKHMLTYCYLSREHTPKEEMEHDGCILRENYMKKRILEASKKYKKILVVTGGFHTFGLLEEEVQDVKLHSISKENQGVYVMSYSMEAADALNGYASGMEAPGFYHKVWTELENGTGSKGAYRESLLNTLIQVGKEVKKKEEILSSYDEICAFSMAQGLAELRNKREPGLYELRDCVLSSFVKGEYNLSTDEPVKALRKITTGKEIGKLCSDAKLPPLVQDFENICSSFKLKIHSTIEQEVVLELFSKKKHMEMSRFFYRMEFLETDFTKKVRGANLIGKKDRNLVRETWKYKWNAQVMASLIDQSVSGGTLEEACTTLVHRALRQENRAKEVAKLLVQAFLMGLSDKQNQWNLRLEQVFTEDGDFFSLTGGLSHLVTLYELQDLYQTRNYLKLEEMMESCFRKLIVLLPSMAGITDEQLKDCMEACLLLYRLTRKEKFSSMESLLKETFEILCKKKGIHPGLKGAVLGLLYGYDHEKKDEISHTFMGYIRGTKEKVKETAVFMRGLFFTARDLVFVSSDFVEMIDFLLKRLQGDELMELLPELRMAFSYFTPKEIDRIAQKAAALYGKDKGILKRGTLVTPKEYAYGETLDAWAKKKMEEE